MFRDSSHSSLRAIILVVLLSWSPPTLAATPFSPKAVGFGVGLVSAIAWHEIGHAVVAKLYGWELEGFIIGSPYKDEFGAVTMLRPPRPLDYVRNEYLGILAAGSLVQIVPVLVAPVVARDSGSAYVHWTMDYFASFGAFDFSFYAGKDLLLSLLDPRSAGSGDWRRFADLSGIPLSVIFGASLIWSYGLIQYHSTAFKPRAASLGVHPIPAITLLNVNLLAF